MNTYKTIREAAIAGTLAAIELGRKTGWEHGGVVIANPNGSFSHSEIVTSKSWYGVSLESAYPAPWNTLTKLTAPQFEQFRKKVVAFFHVHVPGQAGNSIAVTDTFSGQDVDAMISLRSLAYLGDGETGDVYEVDARTADAFIDSIQDLRPDPNSRGIASLFAIKGTRVYEATKGRTYDQRPINRAAA